MKNKNKIEKIITLINRRFEYPVACNLYEKALSDGKSDLDEIAKILAIDPITSATTIKIANSAMFNMKGQVSDLTTAIRVVGTRRIKEVLYLDAARRLSLAFCLSEEKLQHYWRKSLMLAFLSKTIGKALKSKESELLFVTGLLSLIGEVPVMFLLKGKWVENIPASNDNYPWDIRKKQYGFTFNELSSHILDSWGFPAKNIIPIKNAHKPDEVMINDNVKIIQAAFILCLPYSFEKNYTWEHVYDQDKVQSLGIDSASLKTIYSYCIDLTEEMLNTVMSASIEAA